jgi:NAD(P)-dependent dehydrogenase (short-subunit alcohol dehydrogenase family)
VNPSSPALAGQVCLVTGGTGGIGRVTARELARRGAHVAIVGRDAARGAAVAAQLRREAGHDGVEFLAADLSSLAQVRALAGAFLARHARLDMLVNNAGALFAVRRESADGHEQTLALNHLGPFLLTRLLLDALRAAPAGRIVNLSSEAHRDVPAFDFADPQARRRGFGGYPRSEAASVFYSLALPMAHPGFLQYARCKLATVLFTRELARRLHGGTVTANAVNPGLVASEFSAGNGLYGWFMRRYAARGGIPVEDGAATSIHVASAPEVAGVSGAYFTRCEPVECAPAGRDDEAAGRLWELSEGLTG